MPNISFDIFYNTDLVNFTVSRSGGAPRAKPDWKVRQAPKLAPKPKPTPENTFGKKPSQTKQLPPNAREVEEVQSESGESVKSKAPKLNGQANGTAKKQPPKLNQSGSKAPPKIGKKEANTLANQGYWIAGMISNGVQTAIQPGVAAAGGFAGGTVSSVGNGINSVGESINSYVRRYGTGVQDYGNAIRDWSAADGPRAQTASNPLGLSSTAAGGKIGVTAPRLPAAVQRSNSSPPALQKKRLEAAKKSGAQKAIGGGPAGKASPLAAKSSPAKPGSNKTSPKASENGKVKISAASKPQSSKKPAPSSKPLTGMNGNKPAGALKQKGGVNHLYMGA